VSGCDKRPAMDRGGMIRGGGTYTWLRERESGERWKASDDGAGMTEVSQRWQTAKRDERGRRVDMIEEVEECSKVNL